MSSAQMSWPWASQEQAPAQAHDTHPGCRESTENALRVGDRVAVFALAPAGPSIEGTGVIHSHADIGNHYWIRFANEQVLRMRFINPDWQAATSRSLELLLEYLRSASDDNPMIEDFFPNSST
jgi:hypothetical protein